VFNELLITAGIQQTLAIVTGSLRRERLVKANLSINQVVDLISSETEN